MTQWPDVVYEGDTLYISCAVLYSGTLSPEITWHPRPKDSPTVRLIPPNDEDGNTTFSDAGTVNSTFKVRVPARADVVQKYTCYVAFDGSIFPSAANRTSAVETSGIMFTRLRTIPLYSKKLLHTKHIRVKVIMPLLILHILIYRSTSLESHITFVQIFIRLAAYTWYGEKIIFFAVFLSIVLISKRNCYRIIQSSYAHTILASSFNWLTQLSGLIARICGL